MGEEEGECEALVGEAGEEAGREERCVKAPSREGREGGALARTRRSSVTVTVCLRAWVGGTGSIAADRQGGMMCGSGGEGERKGV